MRALAIVAAILFFGWSPDPTFVPRPAQGGPPPFLVPSAEGVIVKTLLTAGDSVPLTGEPQRRYRMVGTPDGLGAFDNGDGTFTLTMNHELAPSAGVVRRHGSAGAFVSTYRIDKATLNVLEGSDLISSVRIWDAARRTHVEAPTAFSRLCSADIPQTAALFNIGSRKGYEHRMMLGGEEAGAAGRAFAHIVTGPDAGQSWEIASLGRASFENVVANPTVSDRTVVVATDDSVGGQVYVQVGEKRSTGTPLERAGLSGTRLLGISAPDMKSEVAQPYGANKQFRFTSVDLGDVRGVGGDQVEARSRAASVSGFLRPEDGAWDPRRPSDFYFNTTADFDSSSRIWRLRFDSALDPAAGGTLEVMYEGPSDPGVTAGGPKMMDNLTVDPNGRVIIQEDPGDNDYLPQIFTFDVDERRVRKVAGVNPKVFARGGSNFLTTDVETSGVIPAFDVIGPDWYLAVVQAHSALPGEIVEAGQLVALKIPAQL